MGIDVFIKGNITVPFWGIIAGFISGNITDIVLGIIDGSHSGLITVSLWVLMQVSLVVLLRA